MSVLTGKKLEDAFKAATDAIQSLPKNGPFQPSNELLLKFYGYYKQSTCGPCDKPRPGMFKVVERAKWDAWNSVRKLSKEEAMNAYIDEIKNIVETMPHSETVQKFLDNLGPFYEYVDDNNEPINNNDKNLTDFNENQANGGDVVNEKVKMKTPNGVVNNVNGQSATNVEVSDDEEDFCDTNDNIDTIQAIKILKAKVNGNGPLSNSNSGSNGIVNGSSYNHDNDSFEVTDEQNCVNNNNNNVPITMATTPIYNNQPFYINQFGGESNSSQTFYQMQSRPSRPSSTQSNSLQRTSMNIGNGGNASSNASGFGGPPPPPPNDPFSNLAYLNNDTNRQILLLLMRLQQDTNNVLTRLSYLEATVMSIQNNLQMNRIENTIQATNRITNGYSNGNGTTNGHYLNSSSSIWSYFTTFNVDWKTVFIAIIGPLVIRLVFLLLKKLKLFIQLKRSRRLL